MCGLFDHGQEVVGPEPAGEVVRGACPRRDPDAVVTVDHVVIVARIGSVWHHPSRDRRVARRWCEHMDPMVGREPAESPQPSGRRTGDGDVGASRADSGAAGEFGVGRARGSVGAAEHEFEILGLLEVAELPRRQAGVEELLCRGDAVLACEQFVGVTSEVDHIEPPGREVAGGSRSTRRYPATITHWPAMSEKPLLGRLAHRSAGLAGCDERSGAIGAVGSSQRCARLAGGPGRGGA